MNKKIKCPCCGYYSIDSDDVVIVDICEICMWQYDLTAHEYPDRVIGPNHISLNEARANYKLYGVSDKEFIGKNMNRAPRKDEMSEN